MKGSNEEILLLRMFSSVRNDHSVHSTGNSVNELKAIENILISAHNPIDEGKELI
jgi:hypothetical protein